MRRTLQKRESEFVNEPNYVSLKLLRQYTIEIKNDKISTLDLLRFSFKFILELI